MTRFYPLKIKEVRPETRDAVSVVFDVPDTLRETFSFTQGQYLVLRTLIDGDDIRRSYSICSAVDDGEIRVAVKRVPNGRFSNYINDRLKAGQTLEVMPPEGRFNIPLDPEHRGRYLMVAAGSGITPILSLIKTTLQREPFSKITLIYGNRSSHSTLFRETLEDLKNSYMDRFNLIFMFSREKQDLDLYNGRIDEEKCEQLFSRWLNVAALDAAFLCGPYDMVETVRNTLQRFGLPAEDVHTELFTAPDAVGQRVKAQPALETDAKTSAVTIIRDGRALEFALKRNTLSLLDAGNAQGADMPYSCKAGVCSTCRARVVKGEVEMDNNFALEDYEVAAGYVLTCQCYPVSDEIVLDFDQ